MSKQGDGRFAVSGVDFPVKILKAIKSPDIGILYRLDNISFVNPIPLCPLTEIPWIVDPAGWECRVKCYHCPVDVFNSTDMPFLCCNVTNYNSVAFHSGHHFAVTEEFLGGSSGGAMILEQGHKLIGLLITTLVRKTVIDDVEVADASEGGSITCSVVDPSITYTTAVVPAQVTFSERRRELDIFEFIKVAGF